MKKMAITTISFPLNNYLTQKQSCKTNSCFFLRSKIQIVQILMIDYYAEILTNWHHLSRMLISTNK